MATDDQRLQSLRTASTGQARSLVAQAVTLTVAGNTTVKGNIVLPAGSWLDSLLIETPVAISGSPTHSYVRAGSTDGGQDIVADVDAQAQGHIAATIVAALDRLDAAASQYTVFYQLTTTGGTSSAGDVDLIFKYFAPVF